MRAFITAALACTAMPAMAQDFGSVDAAGLYVPPQGCTLQLTVQSNRCRVSQHYTCAGDAPGDQHTVYFDREGMSYHSRIDTETRWMESHYLRDGVTEWLDEGSADHASFSELLETGRDDMDFIIRDNRGARMRYVGFDELPGTMVEIDGEPLMTTRFELTATLEDGTFVMSRRGEQFISRDMRRFFGGRESGRDWTGADIKSDDTPRTFRREGQEGFALTRPQFGCDEMVSDAVLAPAPHKTNA